MKVEIKLDLNPGKRFPLHRKYDDQAFPQECGFELDLKSGLLSTYISAEIGNAIPEPVWNNRILRFEIEPLLIATKIQEIAEANVERFQTILDGSEIIWNGSNNVGRLNDAANDLHEEWKQLCLGFEASQLITVEELMEYVQEPQTLAELEEVVNTMVGYDGTEGFYLMYEPGHWIERDILYWLIEKRLYAGEKIGPEIARLIIDWNIDVGVWQSELRAFAAAEAAQNKGGIS